MIQEFVLDGAVMQVRMEVIGRVCLRSATGCQLHVYFCINRTIRMARFITLPRCPVVSGRPAVCLARAAPGDFVSC